MNTQETKQYIIDQRANGIPDNQIYNTINKSKAISKERGFAGEILPTLGAIGGGILGAIGGGFISGPAAPAGAFAGGVAGAAAGGALGEYGQQKIEEFTGEREDIDVGQIAGTGIISGGLQAIGGPITKIAGKAISPVVKLVRPGIIKTMSALSGYSDDIVKKALERSPGAVAGIKGGEKVLADLVQKSASKISQYADDLVIANRKIIENLSKYISYGGPGKPASRNAVLKEGRKFVDNITTILRKNHNIGVSNDGILSFMRPNQPSRIVSGGEQKAIQEGFNLVQSIKNNTSIKHIDAILERLIVLKTKTPVGSPSGPQVKAIINNMMDEIQKFVQTTYPEYYKHLTTTLPKRIMVNEAKELFGGSKNLSPLEISQISGRLLQLYNTGRIALREGVEEIGKEISEDITGTVAGTIMKLDDAFSFRAQNLGTRNIIMRAIEGIPRKIIDNYVKTGEITGDLLKHSAVLKTSELLKISIKSAAIFIANQLVDKKKD